MLAGGFTVEEAHVLMPLIGMKDVLLAILTLVCPCELALVWMTAWAFSTALYVSLSSLFILCVLSAAFFF